jgi:hypothetical protein
MAGLRPRQTNGDVGPKGKPNKSGTGASSAASRRSKPPPCKPLPGMVFRNLRREALHLAYAEAYPPTSPSCSGMPGTMYFTGFFIIVHSPVSLL